MRVGEPVIAIGSPFGLRGTVTSGIVSGPRAARSSRPNGFTIDEVVQTDAAINPGNSGGPLIDERGRVIGVNAQIASSGNRSNSGVGFAIPIDTAKDVIPELRRSGEVKRAYLGVSSADVDSGVAQRAEAAGRPRRAGADRRPRRPGRRCRPARRPRARPQSGLARRRRPDREGRATRRSPIRAQLADAIATLKPGDEVRIEYFRGDERRSAQVTLSERPDQANQG